ncbi:9956_t:CDS:2, partial [Racocetra persica]
NLITPQQRRDIFYCSQLDDDIEETKQTWRLLNKEIARVKELIQKTEYQNSQKIINEVAGDLAKKAVVKLELLAIRRPVKTTGNLIFATKNFKRGNCWMTTKKKVDGAIYQTQEKAEIAAEKMAAFQAAVGLRKELSVLLTEAEAENDYEKLKQSANASLPELERKAQQDVWTDEELTALEKEITEFPPYIEKQPEPEYYRGFQVNYQNQKSINQRLERAKEGAKKNADDYKKTIKDIDAILNKNIKQEYIITAFRENLTPLQQKVKQVKAKKVYENACQNDADGVVWERGLDDEEKNQIKKAKTPDQVKQEQENIA